MTLGQTGTVGRHMAVHRDLLRQAIDGYTAAELAQFTGRTTTRAQALADLAADPRTWFTGCDNTTPDGECLGHGITASP